MYGLRGASLANIFHVICAHPTFTTHFQHRPTGKNYCIFRFFWKKKKFLYIRICSLKGRVLYNFLFFHRPRSEFGTVSSRNCDFTDGLKPLVKWLSPPLFSRFFVCSGEVPPPLIDLQFSLLKIGWDCQIFILPIYQYILPIIFILQTIFQVIYKIWAMSTNVPCHWWRRKFNEQ